MINTAIMEVEGVLKDEKDLQILTLEDGSRAYNYTGFTGVIGPKDKVVVNTTAVDLKLGTGGYHFVISKVSPTTLRVSEPGHIMKLRYTPLQLKTFTLEEQLGEELDYVNVNGHIVIPIELHSMLVPIVLALKKLAPSVTIGYVMTDGAALPAFHSEAVKTLKKHSLIEGTITAGHSFGGDYESVNFITAIQGSVKLLKSQVTIIGMGPGIVGTGTKYGFSGVEQGFIADMAANLGCSVYPALRIGFADVRERHKGISHHSLTIFNDLISNSFPLVLPHMGRKELKLVLHQLRKLRENKKHQIYIAPGVDIEDEARKYNLRLSSMGRGPKENPEFFDCLTALAKFIYEKKLVDSTDSILNS